MIDGVDDNLQLAEAGGLVPDTPLTPSSPVPPLSIKPHPLSSSVSPPNSPGSPTITISNSEKLSRKPHPRSLDMRKLSIPTSVSLDCIKHNGGKRGEREGERERERVGLHIFCQPCYPGHSKIRAPL